MRSFAHLIFILSRLLVWGNAKESRVICTDPTRNNRVSNSDRKYLIVGHDGQGIGNTLIFFPAVYYFALLTGRDILIKDDSGLGEFCTILHCGYITVKQYQQAYPHLLTSDDIKKAKKMNAHDFKQYMNHEYNIEHKVVYTTGYNHVTNWLHSIQNISSCLNQYTGCLHHDFNCYDRHALQTLIKGPFYPEYSEIIENQLINAPNHLNRTLFRLPYKFIPKVPLTIHLRCQFTYFEKLVDPRTDIVAQHEIINFLNSTLEHEGVQLFKTLEKKILQLIPHLQMKSNVTNQISFISDFISRLWLHPIINFTTLNSTAIITGSANGTNTTTSNNNIHTSNITNLFTTNMTVGYQQNLRHYYRNLLQSLSTSTKDSTNNDMNILTVTIHLISDNVEVKEAFAAYMSSRYYISIMRLKHDGPVVHIKSLKHIREVSKMDGILGLVADWYTMSLSTVLIAWRNKSSMLSTFAKSAKLLSSAHVPYTLLLPSSSSSLTNASFSVSSSPYVCLNTFTNNYHNQDNYTIDSEGTIGYHLINDPRKYSKWIQF